MEKLDIEVASEYLVMAAELMLLKSNSLLPNNKEEETIEIDEEISRENLINRLVEYQKYKELTKDFKKLEHKRKDIYTKAPMKVSDITNKKIINDTDITVEDLTSALTKFLERKEMEKPINTKITNKEYSVKKRKSAIKKFLKNKKKVEFTELFDIYSKSYIVVTFMSILELVNENEITISQKENFSNIYIKLKD